MITKSAVIASGYVLLTVFSSLFGLSNGLIQLRLSETLCILPIYTVSAIPGLTVGCFISNILSGGTMIDMVFGSIATLIGAIGTRLLRNKKYLALVSPILSNAIVVPLMLYYGYQIKQPYWLILIAITAAETITAGVLGGILMNVIEHKKILKDELLNDR